MTGYTQKQPVNYQYPNKHMLHDFSVQIEQYKNRRKITPNYIIINPYDRDNLLLEMQDLHLIPHGLTPAKLQFQGIRIIESQGIIKGFFEVVGN